jgi:hypothetical protein
VHINEEENLAIEFQDLLSGNINVMGIDLACDTPQGCNKNR